MDGQLRLPARRFYIAARLWQNQQRGVGGIGGGRFAHHQTEFGKLRTGLRNKSRDNCAIAVEWHEGKLKLIVRAADFRARAFKRENVSIKIRTAWNGNCSDVLMRPRFRQTGANGS